MQKTRSVSLFPVCEHPQKGFAAVLVEKQKGGVCEAIFHVQLLPMESPEDGLYVCIQRQAGADAARQLLALRDQFVKLSPFLREAQDVESFAVLIPYRLAEAIVPLEGRLFYLPIGMPMVPMKAGARQEGMQMWNRDIHGVQCAFGQLVEVQPDPAPDPRLEVKV